MSWRVAFSACFGIAVLSVASPHASLRPTTDSAVAQSCTGSNLYEFTSAELTACGYDVYPLTSVTSDPVVGDSVTDYNYDINGQINTLTVPASSFDPLTASPSVLAILGFPPRPSASDSAAYEQWVTTWGQETSSSWMSPPPFLVVDPNLSYSATTDWVGYYDTAENGDQFTDSEATWVEPTPGIGCSDTLTGYWAGLGDAFDNSGLLEQAGTAQSTVEPTINDEGWYEYLPADPVYVDLYATENEKFSSNMEFVDIPGGYDITWQLENDYANESMSGGEANISYDTTTAEAIIERVVGDNLTNFGDEGFTAYDSGGGYHSGDGAYGDPVPVAMYNSAGTVQDAKPIDYSDNSGDYSSWTDEYENCQY